MTVLIVSVCPSRVQLTHAPPVNGLRNGTVWQSDRCAWHVGNGGIRKFCADGLHIVCFLIINICFRTENYIPFRKTVRL